MDSSLVFPLKQGERYAIRDELMAYLAMFPQDEPGLRPLVMQLDQGENIFNRRNFTGHITGAGIVLSPDRQKILMVHHKLYDRWQQPGGHVEATDATPLAAAYREVSEETSAQLFEVLPVRSVLIPIHISVHHIPDNPAKGEAEHMHYDFRYVFMAADEKLQPQTREVYDVAWVELDDPRTLSIMESVRRLKSHILTQQS